MYLQLTNNYCAPCGAVLRPKGNVIKVIDVLPDRDGDVRIALSHSTEIKGKSFYISQLNLCDITTINVTKEGVEAYESH